MLVKFTQNDLRPNSLLGFKVNESTHTYNSMVNALKTAGFKLVTGASWNVLWTGIIRPSKLKLIS